MSNLLGSQGMPRPSALHRSGGRIAPGGNGMLPISLAADTYSVVAGGVISELPAWPLNVPVTVRFEGGTTLVHSAKLTVQGAANFVTSQGDIALFLPRTAGGWQVYVLSAGQFLTSPFSLKADGRLTLLSADPAPAADQLAKGTIFYTPYCGNVISLYDGAKWVNRTFTEISLALTATSGKPYDVFVFDNAGVAALEILVWTDDTNRATPVVRQDGVLCKSGDLTRRLVGTIYASATNQCEDSLKKRFVSNLYNEKRRALRSPLETTDTWQYTTGTIRQANANAANQFEFVRCVDEHIVDAILTVAGSNTNPGSIFYAAFGLDSTTVFSTDCHPGIGRAPAASIYCELVSHYSGQPGIGRHTLAWLERGDGTGTTTWMGDNGLPLVQQSGMRGSVMA